MFEIFYKPEALEDISDACKYYNSQLEGLEKRFLDELDEVIDYLEMNPFLTRVHFNDIHEAPMKVFPYSVIYKVESKQVIIFSIFDSRQNPKNKNSRIK